MGLDHHGKLIDEGVAAADADSITPVAFKDLTVDLQVAGDATRGMSEGLAPELKCEHSGEVARVLLPLLEEGDMLRLE